MSKVISKAPLVSQRDATNPEFWNERFVQQRMPWDKGGVPLALQHYFNDAAPVLPSHCLIPGCGNGYEVAYLSELGLEVTAIDFSSAAVASARAAHPRWAERIVQADFFDFQAKQPLAFIYERAFLGALPHARRTDIVEHWAKLLAPQALLLGFFYIAENPAKSGPPFAMTQTQLTSLLAPYFVCIEDKPVEDSLAVFNQHERWQVWQRLPSPQQDTD